MFQLFMKLLEVGVTTNWIPTRDSAWKARLCGFPGSQRGAKAEGQRWKEPYTFTTGGAGGYARKRTTNVPTSDPCTCHIRGHPLHIGTALSRNRAVCKTKDHLH